MYLTNTFRGFRYRDYFIFWCGLFVGANDRAELADLPTNQFAILLGLEGFCLGLPRVLFSVLGGAIVDRADRKTIFVVAQSAFLIMTLFLGVMDHWGTIRVWHLLTVSALTGFFVSFEQPVPQSILHHLVPRPDLPNAVTLYQMVFNGSMLFRPSLGGMLISWIDTKGCFFVATVRNLIVLLTIFVIRIPRAISAESPKSLTRDMIEGFNLAWRTPIFVSLFTVLGIVSFCTKPYTQFMAGLCPGYSPRRRAGSWSSADGSRSGRDPGRPHARIDSPLSKAPSPAVLSRRGFRIVHRSFRRLAPFLPVAIDFVYRRRIPNHFPFRYCNAAANSRGRNQPGSHHVAFRLDQSRAWTDG
jgi:hypothetical protein